MSDELLRVVAGSPTEEELAAVTAVVHAVLEQEQEQRSRRAPARTDAWARSQRPLRGVAARDDVGWRSFGG